MARPRRIATTLVSGCSHAPILAILVIQSSNIGSGGRKLWNPVSLNPINTKKPKERDTATRTSLKLFYASSVIALGAWCWIAVRLQDSILEAQLALTVPERMLRGVEF